MGERQPLMSMEEAARELGCCRQVLRGIIKARRLPYILVGRRKKIDPRDLEAYRRENRQTAPEPVAPPPRRRRLPSGASVLRLADVKASMLAKRED